MERQRRRRVVIVGIPGVGKSTVIAKLVDLFHSKGKDSRVVNYGTVMMEQATKLYGVKSRDDLRKLSVDLQRALQVYAASEISKMSEELILVDTHLFISTSEGYWPGMPLDVLQALKPTNLVLVTARPEEILSRRRNDPTRSRDAATEDSLEVELAAADSLLYSSSIVADCPALRVQNSEGSVEKAATTILNAITSS